MKWSSKITRRIIRSREKISNYQFGLLWVWFFWGTYFTWLWANIFRSNSSGDIIAGYPIIWADWAAHLTYASVFAYREPADWFIAHPLFAGAKFSYPFLPDAISGLLMRTGINVVPSFIIPSIIVTFILLYALYRFTYHFTGRVKSAVLALSLFFLSGGLGFFFNIFRPNTIYEWFTHLPNQNIYFINFVVGEMIPQRNFLFGLPIALTIILLLEKLATKKSKSNKRLAILTGLLAGSLTVIHPHSLIIVFIVSALYLLRYRTHYKLFLWYAATAAIPISLYAYTFLLGSSSGALPHWQPGWMTGNSNFIVFELLNFGIVLPLGIYSAWRQKWLQHPLFISAVLVFVLCHVVSFQTWEWDNTKLLTYSYLFMLLPISKQLLSWWENRSHKINKKSLATVCVALLGTSGMLDILSMSQTNLHSYMLVESSSQNTVAQFRDIAPSGSIVIAQPKSDQPFTMLGNTQSLMSYDGWLWSYGIDFSQTRRDIGDILSGSKNAMQLLKLHRVSYIIVDAGLRDTYTINDDFISQFPIAMSSQDVTIYKITL